MANLLTSIRDELYAFWNNEISKKIKTEPHNEQLKQEIIDLFETKFSFKYSYIIKQYGDCLRVSVLYRPLGITFFMAEVKNNGKKYEFKDPTYWGK